MRSEVVQSDHDRAHWAFFPMLMQVKDEATWVVPPFTCMGNVWVKPSGVQTYQSTPTSRRYVSTFSIHLVRFKALTIHMIIWDLSLSAVIVCILWVVVISGRLDWADHYITGQVELEG